MKQWVWSKWDFNWVYYIFLRGHSVKSIPPTNRTPSKTTVQLWRDSTWKPMLLVVFTLILHDTCTWGSSWVYSNLFWISYLSKIPVSATGISKGSSEPIPYCHHTRQISPSTVEAFELPKKGDRLRLVLGVLLSTAHSRSTARCLRRATSAPVLAAARRTKRLEEYERMKRQSLLVLKPDIGRCSFWNACCTFQIAHVNVAELCWCTIVCWCFILRYQVDEKDLVAPT